MTSPLSTRSRSPAGTGATGSRWIPSTNRTPNSTRHSTISVVVRRPQSRPRPYRSALTCTRSCSHQRTPSRVRTLAQPYARIIYPTTAGSPWRCPRSPAPGRPRRAARSSAAGRTIFSSQTTACHSWSGRLRTSSRVCDHSRDRDPSAGGETYVRSVRNGCSPAGHDRATEVVAIGSARQAIRERRLP